MPRTIRSNYWMLLAFIYAVPCFGQTAVFQHPESGHWYSVGSEPLPWHNARAYAISIGGDLATPATPDEQRFVDYVRMAWGISSFWLGGFQDLNASDYSEPLGAWRWISDRPWTWSNWANAEPSDPSAIWNFLAMQLTGYWESNASTASKRPMIEWSADCNADGIVDYGQLYFNSLADDNHNGIPDCCEYGDPCIPDCDGDGVPDHIAIADGALDCNGNGLPDTCEFGVSRATAQQAPFGSGHPLNETLTGLLPALSNVLIVIEARADLDTPTEFAQLFLNGQLYGTLWTSNGLHCPALTQRHLLTLTADAFNQAVTDGLLTITLTASSLVSATECPSSVASVTISYIDTTADCNANATPDPCDIASGILMDCDGNGVADSCDIFADDCDSNGVPDQCQLMTGNAFDCNRNGILDHCDIALGYAADCDQNGIPDSCDPDCDGDGIPDACEILDGAASDCDTDGVPDVCAIALDPDLDCDSNGVPDVCEIALGGYDCDENGILDSCEIGLHQALDDNRDRILDACQISRGDLDLDGVVGSDDLAILLSLWGSTGPSLADLNGDGIVDGGDLGIMLIYWGPYWHCPGCHVLEFDPDPSVVPDATLRAAIEHTGLPWRILDSASAIEMVLVPAGSFSMGCSSAPVIECYDFELPVHLVTLSQAFYLATTEVTQAQWTAVMGSNPSNFDGALNSPSRPVETVSWSDIQQFESRTGLRLPTEAEWEFACRAGTQTAFNNGSDDVSTLSDSAWFSANSGNQTRPVASKLANGLGLYDMHGNVSEWCEDWRDAAYYASSPPIDPNGPSAGVLKIARGGAYNHAAAVCRSSMRSGYWPSSRSPTQGARMARTPIQDEVCHNGRDDDGDGLIDCDDPDCAGDSACTGLPWALVIEATPDPAIITNEELRSAIIDLGLPWRVRDIASQIEMLLIPPGTFAMGCSASSQSQCQSAELPVHEVHISQPLYVGRYEITQAQWLALAGENPSYFQGFANSASRPVEQVSWDTATNVLDSAGLRLPTEAEWEYACRGGTTTAFNNGSNDESTLGVIAWFAGNNGPEGDASYGTKPVGQKAPNAFGLFDMHGNVWEWCSDWFGGGYYSDSSAIDPQGPKAGLYKVLRGSAWYFGGNSCRSSSRTTGGPANAYESVGIRAVRNP